jgi:DNA-binding transcriptional LysR family regulator
LLERLNELATFAAVVEQGSFTAAARELSLSKPVVSKRVARLEDSLGLRLLNRTTRRLSLTEAGEQLYERCRHLLLEVEQAELALRPLASAPRGLLKVNAPMSFGVLHIASCLPDFLHRYPEVQVDMTFADQRINLIEEGVDLAIRIGKLDDSSLRARRLAPSCRILCASPGYLKRRGEPREPQDLKQHDCLIYSYQRSPERWSFQNKGKTRQVSVSGPLKANNGDALRAACEEDLGIAFLPDFIAEKALRAGRLRPLLCDWRDSTETEINAVYPDARNLSPKVRVFIDFLVERFGPEPYWQEGLLEGEA